MGLWTTGGQLFIGNLLLNNESDPSVNAIADAFQIAGPSTTVPPLYMSLHSLPPTSAGLGEPTAAEYEGYARASYSRTQSLSAPRWSTAVVSTPDGNLYQWSNAFSIQWPTAGGASTGVTCKYWGMWTASTGGTFIAYGPIVPTSTNFKLGFVETGALDVVVLESGHGLVATDEVYVFQPYSGNLGSAFTTGSGLERTLSADASESVTLNSALTSSGPVLLVKKSSITVAAGNIPTAAAGSIKLFIT
jgi:hypothetical protein